MVNYKEIIANSLFYAEECLKTFFFTAYIDQDDLKSEETDKKFEVLAKAQIALRRYIIDNLVLYSKDHKVREIESYDIEIKEGRSPVIDVVLDENVLDFLEFVSRSCDNFETLMGSDTLEILMTMLTTGNEEEQTVSELVLWKCYFCINVLEQLIMMRGKLDEAIIGVDLTPEDNYRYCVCYYTWWNILFNNSNVEVSHKDKVYAIKPDIVLTKDFDVYIKNCRFFDVVM